MMSGADISTSIAVLPDGTKHLIAEYAAEQLGITKDEMWGHEQDDIHGTSHFKIGLFNAASTRRDIQEAAERIAARAGETL
jgi:hypothetical protein